MHLVERNAPPQQRLSSRGVDFATLLDDVLAGRATAELHLQPIVDLRGGVVAGYEALARFPWEAGLPPNVWFERAASLGLGQQLHSLMLRKALQFRELLPLNCFLTVNAAPDFILSPEWQRFLQEFPDLSKVIVEITEEQAIFEYGALRDRAAEIREYGGLIAVDDAGAGYASLQHILEIKPDFIKIDRHFVQNCGADRARSTMIEMVGAAADRLNAWIIAEGIETMAELEELTRLEIPLAQGYLLGRPEPQMRQLDDALAHALRSRRPSRWSKDEMGSLAEHLTSCGHFWTRDAAEAALRANDNVREALVVDPNGRPVELVERHALLGVRVLRSFLRAQISSHPVELLDRALTRDEALRFDPVVAINEEGHALGIVSVDRLVSGLLPRQKALLR